MSDVFCEFCGRNISKAERNGEKPYCFYCWQPWMGPYKP